MNDTDAHQTPGEAAPDAPPATSDAAPQAATQPAQNPPVPPAAPTPTVQPMLETEARTWAMLVHLIAAVAAFLSAGTLSWLAPLVIWLIFKDRSALVDHHGKQNLNLQLTVLVTGVGAVVLGLMLFVVGIVFTLILWGIYWLYAMIISIVAAVKANNGEYYSMPLIIPFLR